MIALARLVAALLGILFDPTLGLPPCEWEDSQGCYWDAETMGNGVGRSYTVFPNGEVFYWDGGGDDLMDNYWSEDEERKYGTR